MDCTWTVANKFRTRLEFKQYDIILTKEQSVLAKLMSSFEGRNMKTQYNGLGYRIKLYFHDYKLATEIDENGQSDRSIGYERKRQKAIEQELGGKIIRIDPDKEYFDILELSLRNLDTLNN